MSSVQLNRNVGHSEKREEMRLLKCLVPVVVVLLAAGDSFARPGEFPACFGGYFRFGLEDPSGLIWRILLV